MASDAGPMSEDELTKLIKQLVTNAMPGGILDTDVRSAVKEVTRMAINAAAIEMWRADELEFGWRDSQLTMRRVQS